MMTSTFQWVPGDEAGLNRFLRDHYIEHRVFAATLLAQSPPIATVDYPIEVMARPEEWLRSHQAMSQSVWTAIGGGQSTDLERVKWDDPSQLQDWMFIHRAWHDSVKASLNL